MVACAQPLSQSAVLLAVPMTTACTLSVDQLKEKLLSAVENGQFTDVHDCLVELERAPITKDILESTRVGAAVNDLRKKIADKWPELSKRCRNLIKHWQKLVEVRPPSCASSANGTPNLVSPSIAKLQRRVTPGTPVNRRVTSTGLTNGRGLTVSPANGSYAPKELLSPNGAMHKSQSVGTDLLAKGEDNRNGKRKLEELNTPNSLKRNKTVVGLSSQGATHSVSAQRMAVQSTSELVAQLSQNLPEHMSIDSSLRQHEEKVKREQQDEELAFSLHHGHGALVSGSSGLGTLPPPERKKRKYERKIKPEQVQAETRESPPSDERRGGLILRLPRIAPIKEEPVVKQERAESPPIHPGSQPTSRPESRLEGLPTTSTGRKVNWMDILPSMEELRRRAEEKAAIKQQTLDDPKKLYLLNLHGEEFVALPYLEDPTVPDFITYKYPDPAQYYAENKRNPYQQNV